MSSRDSIDDYLNELENAGFQFDGRRSQAQIVEPQVVIVRPKVIEVIEELPPLEEQQPEISQESTEPVVDEVAQLLAVVEDNKEDPSEFKVSRDEEYVSMGSKREEIKESPKHSPEPKREEPKEEIKEYIPETDEKVHQVSRTERRKTRIQQKLKSTTSFFASSVKALKSPRARSKSERDSVLPTQRHEGWLHKKGGLRRNWKKRWFVLQEGILEYFDSQTLDSKPLGIIHISGNRCGICAAAASKYEFNFQIITKQRIFFLYATTLEDYQTWKDQLIKQGAIWDDSLKRTSRISDVGEVLQNQIEESRARSDSKDYHPSLSNDGSPAISPQNSVGAYSKEEQSKNNTHESNGVSEENGELHKSSFAELSQSSDSSKNSGSSMESPIMNRPHHVKSFDADRNQTFISMSMEKQSSVIKERPTSPIKERPISPTISPIQDKKQSQIEERNMSPVKERTISPNQRPISPTKERHQQIAVYPGRSISPVKERAVNPALKASSLSPSPVIRNNSRMGISEQAKKISQPVKAEQIRSESKMMDPVRIDAVKAEVVKAESVKSHKVDAMNIEAVTTQLVHRNSKPNEEEFKVRPVGSIGRANGASYEDNSKKFNQPQRPNVASTFGIPKQTIPPERMSYDKAEKPVKPPSGISMSSAPNPKVNSTEKQNNLDAPKPERPGRPERPPVNAFSYMSPPVKQEPTKIERPSSPETVPRSSVPETRPSAPETRPSAPETRSSAPETRKSPSAESTRPERPPVNTFSYMSPPVKQEPAKIERPSSPESVPRSVPPKSNYGVVPSFKPENNGVQNRPFSIFPFGKPEDASTSPPMSRKEPPKKTQSIEPTGENERVEPISSRPPKRPAPPSSNAPLTSNGSNYSNYAAIPGSSSQETRKSPSAESTRPERPPIPPMSKARTLRGAYGMVPEMEPSVYPPPTEVSRSQQEQYTSSYVENTASNNTKPARPGPSSASSRLAAINTLRKTQYVGSPPTQKSAESPPTQRSEVSQTQTSPTMFIRGPIFGVPIESVAKLNGIPIVMEHTISYLEKYGIKEEGILRLAGSASEIKKLKADYDTGVIPDMSKTSDINTVGSLLKQYLRDLPAPLIIQSTAMKKATDLENSVDIVRDEINKVSEDVYYAAKRLFLFLNLIAQNSNYNKMIPANLAIVFSPTLKMKMELLQLLVAEANNVFT